MQTVLVLLVVGAIIIVYFVFIKKGISTPTSSTVEYATGLKPTVISQEQLNSAIQAGGGREMMRLLREGVVTT